MAKKQVKKALSPALAAAQEKRKAKSAMVAKLTPEQRTLELAPHLVSRAIKAIKKVGQLGTARIEGEPKYQLTVEQKSRILSTLKYEVEQLDARLNPGEKKAKKATEFSF